MTDRLELLAAKSALNKTFELEKQLNRLMLEDFPSKAQPDYLRLILEINSHVRKLLEKVQKPNSDAQIQLLRRRSRRLGQFIDFLHYYVQYVHESGIRNVHWGMYESFRELTRRYFPHAFALILKPQWEYNYSYEEIKGRLSGIVDSIRDLGIRAEQYFNVPIIVVSFPIAEKDHILLNCMLAHEIGHFINATNGISAKISFKRPEESKINAIAQRFPRFFLEPGGDEVTLAPYLYVSQVFERIVTLTRSWIRELTVDVIALRMLGPAYFFALLEFLSTNDFDRHTNAHPAPYVRIGFLLKALEVERYHTRNSDLRIMIRDLKNEVKRLTPKPIATPISFDQACFQLALASLRKVMNNIMKQVFVVTRNKAYSARRFQRDIPDLLDVIKGFTPPVEVPDSQKKSAMRQVDTVSILNVGWLFYLFSSDSLYQIFNARSSFEKSDSEQKLNGLITYALELQQIMNRVDTS